MLLKNKVYDFLKKLVTIILPAAVILLTVLNAAWGWDLPIEAIDATISAVCVFIGTCMGISTKNYNAKLAAEENISE